MTGKSSVTTRIILGLIWGIVVTLVIVIPFGYFLISYNSVSGSLEAEAEEDAKNISQLIGKNPDMWMYEQVRLSELLSHRYREGGAVSRRIVNVRNNEIIAESSQLLPPPVAMRSADLWDSGVVVARIGIYRSIRPLLARTGVVALLGSCIGFIIYITLRMLPLRAVRQAEEAMSKAYSELDTRVQERTAELSATNTALEKEIFERKLAEEALRKSEERFCLAMLGATDGLWDRDMKTREIYYSPRWKSMLGYSEEELENHLDTWKSLVHKDDLEPALAIVRDVLEKRGDKYEVEYRMSHKDGRYINILSRGLVVRDAGGKPLRMVGTHVDITERKRAEEALHQSKESIMKSEKKLKGLTEELNTIFNNINATIWYKDTKNNFIRVNEAAADMIGLKEEDINGKSAYDVFPANEAEKSYQDDLEVIRNGVPKLGIVETVHSATGEVKWVSTDKIPTLDSDGNVSGLIAIATDITDYKKLEQQLFHAHKMEAIGQFAGGIAHDFNNIIGAMMGFTTLLQMEMKEDDPARHYLDNLLSLSDKAASLTKSLLAFSRKQILDIRPTSLTDIVTTIEKLMSRVIGEGIKLDLRLSAKDLVVNADGIQLEQALMNLVTNARDAMPEGGTLTISTGPFEMDDDFIKMHGYGKPGKYALLIVEDTGMGIDEHTREKIFEPFFTTKGAGKGTGLGLAMVYGTIKQHDGYIDVYSEVGKGSTFKIYLPAIDREVVEAKSLDNIPRRGGTETILLVEDEASLRVAIRRMLEKFGYKVIEAEDGEEAVNKFNERKDEIQLVLMDVMMPRKSGKEAYQEMQKVQPYINVIFTSGHTENILTSKKIAEEGLHFISKPVSPKELFEKIRNVLDKRND